MLIQTPPNFSWHESLWRETVNSFSANQPIDRDRTADVTIVGAGFTGLRAATLLAEAGKKVIVLDAKDVGWGASGRSGGQVNPMLPFNSPPKIRKLVGKEWFERITSVSLKSADELFKFIENHQIRCGARQNGWLRVLHSVRAHESAERDIRQWNAVGGEMRMITASEVRALTGSSRYNSGVLTSRGGAIQPFSLVSGLSSLAKKLGVKIFAKSPVNRIRMWDNQWKVETDLGTVTSSWVIVATNGYSGNLVPGLAESIIPMNPIQIATEPLPDDIYNSILPFDHTISDSRRIIMYARREPNNRIVYGGLGKISRGKLGGYDWLKKDAVKVFPQLAGANWTHSWGGTIAITGDHLPHIHEPAERLLAGLGYNGRGVAMSFVVGRTLAERVLGRSPNELDLPISQLKPFPWRRLKTTGLDTAISVMRLLDRIEFR